MDFVVQRGTMIWAVEVQSGPGGRPSSGLHRFRRQYPDCRPPAVGGEGMPLQTFFEIPPQAVLGT